MAKRVKATILFATETGKSHDYAKTLCEIFKHAFDAKVLLLLPCITFTKVEHELTVRVILKTSNRKRRNLKKSFLYTPLLSISHSLADEAKQMPAEYRR